LVHYNILFVLRIYAYTYSDVKNDLILLIVIVAMPTTTTIYGTIADIITSIDMYA
jgi:hypothetical protein